MLKAVVLNAEEGVVNHIFLGLSEGNLGLLLRDRPIVFRSGELRLLDQFTLVLFAAPDRAGVERYLANAFEGRLGDDEVLPVVHLVEQGLYVAPLASDDGDHLYLVGLDGLACSKLRAGDMLSVRVRFPTGHALPFRLLLFWGRTEGDMALTLAAEGGPAKGGPR